MTGRAQTIRLDRLALTGLAAVAVILLAAAWRPTAARATEWTIRPIGLGTANYGADVLLRGSGRVGVGHRTTDANGRLRHTLTTIDGNGLTHRSNGVTSAWPTAAASFDADPFGDVFYAARYPHVATFGQFTSLLSYEARLAAPSPYPAFDPVLRVTPGGAPALTYTAGWGAKGASYLRFDIPSGQWVRQDLPSFTRRSSVGRPSRSLCFDAAGLPVILEAGDDGLHLTREGPFGGWGTEVVGSHSRSLHGLSVASDRGRRIGYAWLDANDDLVYGRVNGATEVVLPHDPSRKVFLNPGSLAYDANGTPWLATTRDTGGRQWEVHLHHRQADGNWASERLPLGTDLAGRAYRGADLAFDDAGHPYVLAFGDLVTLLGPALPEAMPGDFDGDNDADADDLDLLFDNVGTLNKAYDRDGDANVTGQDAVFLVENELGTWVGDTDLDGDVDLVDFGRLATHFDLEGDWGWADGDFDGDGDVDLVDFGRLANHWNHGVTGARPPLPRVPEPTAAAVLATGAATLLRRRRR